MITWERARQIFGNPQPPKTVWEKQFDYNDDDLWRLANTPYEKIDFSDLWYYHHDLAYVELQPDLFSYLFPVCLMDWHHSLMQNEPCSHGDSDFHYGVLHGNVFEKMITPKQLASIYEFFRDSFLERLDAERGFIADGSKTPAYGWIGRFNSVGLVMPRIDMLWDGWWSLDTPGRAVAALEYCSALMYFNGENPLFPPWTPDRGGGGPPIWCNDTLFDIQGWLPQNIEFIRKTLTAQFVADRVVNAVARLKHEPECEKARQLENDLAKCRELIEFRVEELPTLLATPYARDEWSV